MKLKVRDELETLRGEKHVQDSGECYPACVPCTRVHFVVRTEANVEISKLSKRKCRREIWPPHFSEA